MLSGWACISLAVPLEHNLSKIPPQGQALQYIANAPNKPTKHNLKIK